MATSAYHTWVQAGRPWTLARPIAQLKTWAQANGIRVLGTIGNEAHLQADFPEDHTPYSFTAWPRQLPGYWVTAIDLDNANNLGGRILMRAQEGQLPWLKYMNSAGRNYAYADGFRSGRPNADQHVHLSVFSDELETDIGDFSAILEGDMPLTDADIQKVTRSVRDMLTMRVTAGSFADRENWWEPGKTAPPAKALELAWGYGKHAYRSLAALHAKVDAVVDLLEGLVPGIAEAVALRVSQVSAADVADELEVTVKET